MNDDERRANYRYPQGRVGHLFKPEFTMGDYLEPIPFLPFTPPPPHPLTMGCAIAGSGHGNCVPPDQWGMIDKPLTSMGWKP